MSVEPPKVTIHSTEMVGQALAPQPSAAADTASGVDARNRSITIKKLSPLARMRLFKLLGPDGAKNEMLLGYATLAACVISIDGSAEPFPTSERQIEAMVQRLDDDGLAAVGRIYKEAFGIGDEKELDPGTIKN